MKYTKIIAAVLINLLAYSFAAAADLSVLVINNASFSIDVIFKRDWTAGTQTKGETIPATSKKYVKCPQEYSIIVVDPAKDAKKAGCKRLENLIMYFDPQIISSFEINENECSLSLSIKVSKADLANIAAWATPLLSKPMDKAALLKTIAVADTLSLQSFMDLVQHVVGFANKNTDDKALLAFATNIQGYAAEVTNTAKLMKNKPLESSRWSDTLLAHSEVFQKYYNSLKNSSYYVPNKRSVKEVLMKFADQLINMQKTLEKVAYGKIEYVNFSLFM